MAPAAVSRCAPSTFRSAAVSRTEAPGDVVVAPGHPMSDAVRIANDELRAGRAAAAGGNPGRARVCARRAVGIFLQAIAATIPEEVGSNAMANLRWLQSTTSIPMAERDAAIRLAVGARAEAAGGTVSADPLADAALIINYFLRRASV